MFAYRCFVEVVTVWIVFMSCWLCHEQAPTTSSPPIPPLASLLQLRPLPTANSVDASLAFPNSL
uniref:Secreted protein n=1 Tax=Meloidogyne hapla TaxID=6305 RepID=A0A1I8BZ28_MELHA